MPRLGLASLLLVSCAPGVREQGPPPVDLPAPERSPPASASQAARAAPAVRDPVQAKCDEGDVEACVRIADRCSIGAGDKTDVPWASAACAERERRACDLGSGRMCRNLGDRYTDTTIAAGVKKDEATGIKLIDRACELGGELDSCIQMAYRYDGGNGVAKDVKRAVELFQRVCDEESGIFPQPCQALANHLTTGDGIAKDIRRAARIHAATCGQGVCDGDALVALCTDAGGTGNTNEGCVSFALVLVTPVVNVPDYNPKKAKSLLERACRRKDAAGCLELAGWYREGRTFGDKLTIPADPSLAARYTERACAAGSETACKQP